MPQLRFPKELKYNKFFSSTGVPLIESLFDPKALMEKREGDIIYRTGDESAAIYLLLKGEVRIKYSSNNYVSRKKANDFFGEKELIDATRRISSAVAFSNVIYYQIDKSIFAKLIARHPTINNNLHDYGELKIPEINKETAPKFSIVEKVKPISFRAAPAIGNGWGKDKNAAGEKPSVIPGHLLEEPPRDQAENNIENYITPDDLSKELKKELLDDPNEFKDWHFETEPFAEANRKSGTELPLEKISASSSVKDQEEEKNIKEDAHLNDENGINREIVRKIFACIEVIYNSVTIVDLIEKTVKTLKDLTTSESGDLVLIDEKLSLMKRLSFKEKPYREEHFQLPDGLTGTCALQKKILNFERPTEDSRYNSRIDQPGPARLKRILYFPVISEAGETIAVIQLARENKKYSEFDLAYLTMLSKQIVSAIERAYRLEIFLNEERAKSNKKLRDLLLNEIKDPINIINSYTDILGEKKLPQDADDIIRMLQKQANSIEDLSDAVLSSLNAEFKLDLRSIHFNEFIEDVLELLSEYCQAREVTLFKKIGDGALVNIDRGKFYSAVYQIIKYCCEDGKRNGNIYLSTELRDNSIIANIQADGKGQLKNLDGEFKDILSGKEDTTRTDMGLLLARKIITSHHGQIEFDSTKGKGTTFTITIPVSNSSLN